MTLDLWLEQAFDKIGDVEERVNSPVWQADAAIIRLRREWRKEWKRRQWAALRAQAND